MHVQVEQYHFKGVTSVGSMCSVGKCSQIEMVALAYLGRSTVYGDIRT